MPTPLAHHAAAASLAFAATAVALPPFDITPLVLEGDTISGPDGTVTIASVDKVAVNSSGDWVIIANTSVAGATDLMLRGRGTLAATIARREGQAITGPFGPTFIRSLANTTAAINSSGAAALNLSLVDQFNFPQQGALLDRPAPAPTPAFFGFSDQFAYSDTRFATWATFHGARLNDSGSAIIVSTVDDFGIAGTSNRAVVRINLTSDGAVASVSRLLLQGDSLLGQVQTVATTSTEEQHLAWNNAGSFAALVVLNASTPQQEAVNEALYVNATVPIAQEGMPSLVPGRNWAALSGSASAVDLGNAGDVLFRASLAGGGPDAQVLVKNGSLILRTGSPLAAIPGRTLTGIGGGPSPVRTSDAGDVMCRVTWNDPDPNAATGLILNNELLVRAAQSLVDAGTLLTISAGAAGFDLSDNARFAIFIGELPPRIGSVGNASGAFLVRFSPCPADFNADGDLNGDDLADYINCFFAAPPCTLAEFNGDGDVNADDLGDYINAFFGGCG